MTAAVGTTVNPQPAPPTNGAGRLSGGAPAVIDVDKHLVVGVLMDAKDFVAAAIAAVDEVVQAEYMSGSHPELVRQLRIRFGSLVWIRRQILELTGEFERQTGGTSGDADVSPS